MTCTRFIDRSVPRFGETVYDPNKERETVPIAEQLIAFADVIKAGKIRYLGLSNETPWGVSEFSHIAQQQGTALPCPYNVVELPKNCKI